MRSDQQGRKIEILVTLDHQLWAGLGTSIFILSDVPSSSHRHNDHQVLAYIMRPRYTSLHIGNLRQWHSPC